MTWPRRSILSQTDLNLNSDIIGCIALVSLSHLLYIGISSQAQKMELNFIVLGILFSKFII